MDLVFGQDLKDEDIELTNSLATGQYETNFDAGGNNKMGNATKHLGFRSSW